MTTCTDLPATDRTVLHLVPGAYVRQPEGVREPMDLLDVTGLAMDKVLAASLGAPLADDDETGAAS